MRFRTARPLEEVLTTTGLHLIAGAGGARAAHLLADPAYDLDDSSDRQRQVDRWLVHIAMDAGLEGMTQVLRT